MPTADAPRAAAAPAAAAARAAAGARPAAARAPRVTIRAVAEHAGVSRQTVSNALNAPDRLSPGTLERVRRAVAALGYRPDHAARALTSRRSGLIGIRVGSTAHRTAAHPDRLLHELVAAARPYGYRFLAFDAPYGDDAAEIAAYGELLAAGDVDAVVVADTHPGDARPAWLADRGAAFVAHGRPWGDPDAAHPWVDVDGALGVRLVVEHLRARGHRRIGFVGWPADGAGGDARRAAWSAATAEADGTRGPEVTAREDDPDAAAAVVAPLLGRPDAAPTALVCASDALALGALTAVADAGATPGRDVAITGYDDSDLAAFARPGLTSVRQPIRLVAQTLVEQVLDRLGVDLGHRPAPAGLVPPELVVRASSAGPAPFDAAPGPAGARATAA
ncbi:LacI family DNA-binding transcriptional regulator [Cellulomonas sp. PS-H5]|uniref:LacI family DNA-binding transcriptional regulator n=1 Tax=Cellulomonas sp. PS-H5 TaxID=2820400 RepID=UPI001C4E4726|nr:LacI family DNA-binding transcriptional regulator [Cellulomonas sp. PS-H5]MBW0255222.1 LacI family transcriptional regulator [Cellulomonas sp. PS-H5]